MANFLHHSEVRLDCVQPAGVRRRVELFDVVGSHESLHADVLVRVEVFHHDERPGLDSKAGPQSGEGSEQIVDSLSLAHLADEAIGMNVVERQQLLCPLQPPIGRTEALRMPRRKPLSSRQRPQFGRSALVEADDRSVRRTALVEVEEGVLFTLYSASFDAFHVLVC